MAKTKPLSVANRPAARALVLGDAHVPFHDVSALALAHRVAKAVKPTHIISIGDWADCESISNHPKSPERRANLATEIEIAAEKWADFRGMSDETQITLGNHEFRLERYIAQRAPELFGLVSVPELLGLGPNEWTAYKDFYHIGKCAFTHEVGYSGVNAARSSLSAYGGNLVFGHSHRGTVVIDGDMRGERHACMNVGWLGDESAIDYTYKTTVRSWSLGVGLVDFDGDGNCWMQFCPFVGRKCVVGGMTVI